MTAAIAAAERRAGSVFHATLCWVIGWYGVIALVGPIEPLSPASWACVGPHWAAAFVAAALCGTTWFLTDRKDVQLLAYTTLGCAEGGILISNLVSFANPIIIAAHGFFCAVQFVRLLMLDPHWRN